MQLISVQHLNISHLSVVHSRECFERLECSLGCHWFRVDQVFHIFAPSTIKYVCSEDICSLKVGRSEVPKYSCHYK